MLAYRVFTKLSMVLHGTQSLIPLQPVCEEETDSFLFTFFFFRNVLPLFCHLGIFCQEVKKRSMLLLKQISSSQKDHRYMLYRSNLYSSFLGHLHVHIYISVKIPIIHRKNVVSRFIYFNSSFYLLMVF